MTDRMDETLRPFQHYFSHIRLWLDDNEWLCAMDPRLGLRRFCLKMDETLHSFQHYFSHIRLWLDDNEWLCAMDPRLGLRRFCLNPGSNLGLLDQ